MAWTNPITWIAGQIVTAALLNTHVRDNLNELRAGGIAMASQDINDFIYASSATQFGRLGTAGAGGSGRVPTYITPGWQLKTMYPVGSLYFNASDSTNPATLLGFGTWIAFGAGRVVVGIDASQVEFDTLGEVGGAKTHTLLATEVPAHAPALNPAVYQRVMGAGTPGRTNWDADGVNDHIGAEIISQSSGSDGAHNNLPPFIVVHIWQRTV